MTHDVVIVGCGPVGALCANLLGREGLSVLVLEKELDHYPLPRAVHLDHEMMRLLQSAGVIDRVLPDMFAADGHLHIGADNGVIRYMGTVGKPKPFGWSNDWFFYQPELEAHLRSGMAGLDSVELMLGAEFVSVEQDAAGAIVHFQVNGADCTARGRWVIAADGARSPVRKALGVVLDDLKFEEPWLVVDAEVEGPVTFPALTGVPEGADLQRLSVMMCDPARPATVVPGRGNHRRWEFMLLPHEDDVAMTQPERVNELVGAWMKGVPHKIVRAATYRFHGLVAEQWQVGRVFLAGDAAHQTPPFFGQGMCHGFRDAANLAWKIAAIVKDCAPDSLLDSYQPERDPHVRAVIGAAVGAGRYICELDPHKAAARDADIRAQAAKRTGETAADLIPAIQSGAIFVGSPGAGERFIQPLLSDGRMLDDLTGQGWRLFAAGVKASGVGCFDPALLPDGGAISEWLSIRGVDAVLVRPDHYVFGSGNPAELLAARRVALGQAEKLAA